MQARSTFAIDGWDETPGDRIPGGHALSRVIVKKTFRGDLEGTSAAEMLMSKGGDGAAGYVALERIEGSLAGRRGTFVLMHAATMDAGGQRGDWQIVPGSGTGDLAGLRGRAAYRHDAEGAVFELEWEIG